MITLHWLYTLAGAMFAAFALLSALDRSNPKRLGNAAFWGLMALSLLGGDFIGDLEIKEAALAWVPEAMRFVPALATPEDPEANGGTEADSTEDTAGIADAGSREPSPAEMEEAA